jgi:acyl-CoA thioesterase
VAVEPLGDGRYRACIDSAWEGPISPNGGIVAATAVRAAQAELAPGPPPRMIASHFLEPAPTGPSEITVEVLRRGKRVAAADVRMRQAEKLICQTTVVFSAAREQEIELLAKPPQAPPPEQVEEISEETLQRFPPVFRQLRMRPVFGTPQPFGLQEALTGGWLSIRGDEAPLDAARICAISDLWWPAVFGRMERPAAVPTLQLTVHVRSVLPLVEPPVLARFQTRSLIEGHAEESSEIWSADGQLLAESKQMALVPGRDGYVWEKGS